MIDILVNPSDWGGGFIVARASGSRLYKTQMPNDFLLGSTIVPARNPLRAKAAAANGSNNLASHKGIERVTA